MGQQKKKFVKYYFTVPFIVELLQHKKRLELPKRYYNLQQAQPK
jgi:hypothetical protein